MTKKMPLDPINNVIDLVYAMAKALRMIMIIAFVAIPCGLIGLIWYFW